MFRYWDMVREIWDWGVTFAVTCKCITFTWEMLHSLVKVSQNICFHLQNICVLSQNDCVSTETLRLFVKHLFWLPKYVFSHKTIVSIETLRLFVKHLFRFQNMFSLTKLLRSPENFAFAHKTSALTCYIFAFSQKTIAFTRKLCVHSQNICFCLKIICVFSQNVCVPLRLLKQGNSPTSYELYHHRSQYICERMQKHWIIIHYLLLLFFTTTVSLYWLHKT